MGQKRDYHQALSDLAYAGALGTLYYLCDEAQQCLAQARAAVENHDTRPLVLWPDEADQVLRMLRHPQAAFAVLDADGVVLRCNDNMAKPLGCENAASLLGKCVWDMPNMQMSQERRTELAAILAQRRMECKTTLNGDGAMITTCTVPLSHLCALVCYKPVSGHCAFEQAFRPGDRHVIE